MTMPEPKLEFDAAGRVAGDFAAHDVSHRIIEEFMLSANEAVARHLDSLDVPFLRRVHPAPDDGKLQQFAEFARHVGYPLEDATDRFELQRVLNESAECRSGRPSTSPC